MTTATAHPHLHPRGHRATIAGVAGVLLVVTLRAAAVQQAPTPTA